MIRLLYLLLFIFTFAFFQTIVFLCHGTTPFEEARRTIEDVRKTTAVKNFAARKQLVLQRNGASIFLSDGMTTGRWYLYKGMIALAVGFIGFAICKIMGIVLFPMWTMLAALAGWFFPDLYLRLKNRTSNEKMMEDICEMSRSVLYGKRGGQYITDALRDATMVVENKRLKVSLIRMTNSLDAGASVEDCLTDLEYDFSNAEISAFCTIIRSLQATGQVDDALRTLENNIEREQIGINKRRCVVLENTTMMYVMFIAFDILAVILYCIIVKLMAMEMNF